MIIAPSILNIPAQERNSKIKEYENAGIVYLHLDIMDGKFVNNTTEKVSMLEEVSCFDMVKDVHLMVYDVEKYAKQFIDKGADLITFHYEAVEDPLPVIKRIKNSGVRVGLSIKPNTKVEVIKPYLKDIDLVLVMSVEPGFGGQKFIESSLDKIKELDKIRNSSDKYSYQIEVDGGINEENAPLLKTAGANIIVMGTALYKAKDASKVVNFVDNL